jgi:hypothetical protein
VTAEDKERYEPSESKAKDSMDRNNDDFVEDDDTIQETRSFGKWRAEGVQHLQKRSLRQQGYPQPSTHSGLPHRSMGAPALTTEYAGQP